MGICIVNKDAEDVNKNYLYINIYIIFTSSIVKNKSSKSSKKSKSNNKMHS